MITGPFIVSKAFSEGWKLTKKHWLVLVGLMLGYIIVSLLLGLFAGSDMHSAQYWIVQILSIVISFVFSAGYTKMYLVAIDGEEPEFNLFGKMLSRVIPYFVSGLLVGICVIIGLCLLIVPGIWIACRLSFAPYIILDDENCGIMESLRRSFDMTKGHVWQIIGMVLLSYLVILAGIICLIVGVFPASVLVTFTILIAMRMMYQQTLPQEITPETPAE